MQIRNPRTIRALASPVRLAILDALEAMGPCPAADLASVIGLNPDALYYHLRMLLKLGLVTSRAESRGAFFDVAARPLLLAYSRETRRVSVLGKVVAAMLRAALRLYTRALGGSSTAKGPRRELWAAQRFARLGAAELTRLNQLLNAVLDLLAEAQHSPDGGKLYAVTFVLTPVVRPDDAK